MAGEKRFGTSLFGFKQSDVNSYIEKILREFDDKLKEKENEIANLKNQCREIRIKYEDIARKTDQISEDRAKIADVLIKAQEKADTILDEARIQSNEERKKLSDLTEKEKEKLVDIKQEIKMLKQDVAKVLKKYSDELDILVETAEEMSDSYKSIEKIETFVKTDDAQDILNEIMEEVTNKANLVSEENKNVL